MREQLSITDYKGKELGYLNVSTVPLSFSFQPDPLAFKMASMASSAILNLAYLCLFPQVEVVPLNENGKEITEEDDIFIDDPSQLVNLSKFLTLNHLSSAVVHYLVFSVFLTHRSSVIDSVKVV